MAGYTAADLSAPASSGTAAIPLTRNTMAADSTIVYQGEEGAYSHLACRHAYPDMQPHACLTFSEALQRVENGDAALGMIPLENSTAGRVEEIYRQMPRTPLYIVAEHFEPVNHCLLGVEGSSLESIKVVSSHPQALAQCDGSINQLHLRTEAALDTAGAAQEVAARGDPSRAAIASRLAAELYGLQVLRENFQDISANTTRFIVLSRKERTPVLEPTGHYITSLMFQVRNIPAALYKALGGFATNSVNLVKLESYMPPGSFGASEFYVDIEGHRDARPMQLALEELGFFAEWVRLLGTYPAHPARSASQSP